jgi:uridine kinase
MKVCFFISGLLRHFQTKLYPFLEELSAHLDFDVYLHTEKNNNDTKYLIESNTSFLVTLIQNPRYKMCVFDDLSTFNYNNMTTREKNTMHQWYRLHYLYKNLITRDYDWYIRLRPDVNFQCSASHFINSLSTMIDDSIYIPYGNNLFDKNYIQESRTLPINDQIAIVPPKFLQDYFSLYELIVQRTERPLISEYILAEILFTKGITVKRFDLPYILSLSSCKIIAIVGDSGSGKTTLTDSIKKVFPFDKYLHLETDRYHKWDRYDKNWSSYTHLNPEANNLERMLDDTYRLKLGDDIYSVDYDHTTGRFTEEEKVESKEFILLCGLHTLYQDKLRNFIDIKIYINTQEHLKYLWKLERDTKQRNHTTESVIKKIESRKDDYTQYILPQKEFANIIVHYSCSEPTPSESSIDLKLEIKNSIVSYCYFCIYPFSRSIDKDSTNDSTLFSIKKSINKTDLLDIFRREAIVVDETMVENGYNGLLQLVVLKLLIA